MLKVCEGKARLIVACAVYFEEKEAEITTKLGNLETKMVMGER